MPHCAHCRAPVARGAQQCSSCGVTLSGRDQATQPGLGYAMAPPGEDAMIGRSILDQFVVRTKLGEGGMGGVYLADQPNVGRTAVVKVIHPWLSKDPGVSARFDAEARAAARLQNPHIVSIYNYGKLPDGTLFIAMEHIRGSTLAQTLQSRGRFEPSRAVNIAAQCCEALAEAHRQGVVHRDVKPSNIMLAARRQGPGFVKMVDFGVATLDNREVAPGRGLTGTPCYMSPEQLSGQPVDGRSDIYSLAVVIYEMLVGQPPFLAPSPEQYARMHQQVPPPPLSGIAPEAGVPAALEACLMRALAKQPHARPLSAERFSDELWSSVTATGAISIQPHLGSPRRRGGRSRVIGVLAGAVAIAGLGTAAVLWTSEGSRDVEGPEERGGDDGSTSSAAAAAVIDDPVREAQLSSRVVELEAELERVAVLHGHRPDDVHRAMRTYHERTRTTPPGRDRTRHRREILTELILRWAREPTVENQTASIAEIEAVFLRMNSPLDVLDRRRMLYEAKHRDGASPDSIRARVLSFIDTYGLDYRTGDPGAELVLDDQSPAPTDPP